MRRIIAKLCFDQIVTRGEGTMSRQGYSVDLRERVIN